MEKKTDEETNVYVVSNDINRKQLLRLIGNFPHHPLLLFNITRRQVRWTLFR